MLLGWIAGTMAVTDPAIVGYIAAPAAEGAKPEASAAIRYGAGIAGLACAATDSRCRSSAARPSGDSSLIVGSLVPPAPLGHAGLKSAFGCQNTAPSDSVNAMRFKRAPEHGPATQWPLAGS
jgi:hypothetical protein